MVVLEDIAGNEPVVVEGNANSLPYLFGKAAAARCFVFPNDAKCGDVSVRVFEAATKESDSFVRVGLILRCIGSFI